MDTLLKFEGRRLFLFHQVATLSVDAASSHVPDHVRRWRRLNNDKVPTSNLESLNKMHGCVFALNMHLKDSFSS